MLEIKIENCNNLSAGESPLELNELKASEKWSVLIPGVGEMSFFTNRKIVVQNDIVIQSYHFFSLGQIEVIFKPLTESEIANLNYM